MEARELRIGNLVYSVNRKGDVHLLEEVPLVVIDIAHSFVKTYPLGMSLPKVVMYNPFSIRDITPIPLTEEWLIRFGFIKIIHSIKGTSLKDEYDLSFVRISHYLGDFDFKGVTKIKYVHQLQNLYFALTGQELELIK